MDRLALSLGAALLACALPGRAEFVAGRLYVGVSAHELCRQGPDLVYEFDPLTADSRLFASVPDPYCGGLNDLAFRPDGQRLRTGVGARWTILEISGNGDLEVAYGPEHGIALPTSITYDRWGNFYVMNSARPYPHIFRFPADGSPGQRFADVHDVGIIAAAPTGHIYWGQAGARELVRINRQGQGKLFYELPGIADLITDSAGNLFVIAARGIYRFDNGDQRSVRYLGSLPEVMRALALSPDERTLYTISYANGVFAIDPLTGAYKQIGTIPGIQYPYLYPRGLAVYVPEPASLVLFLITASMLARR